MQEIALRAASVLDAPVISDIYLASRKTFLSYAPLAHSDEAIKNWVRLNLIPTEGVTVAEKENQILGFIAVSHEGGFNWIDHLYLAPHAVGFGIGSMLLERAMMVLRPPIRLYTFQQNVGARKFYQRHGFRDIALSDGSSNEERTPDVLLEFT